MSLDKVDVGATPVEAAGLIALELDVVEEVCPDVSAETASTNWVAAEVAACRVAPMRFCCWFVDDIELIDMICPRVTPRRASRARCLRIFL